MVLYFSANQVHGHCSSNEIPKHLYIVKLQVSFFLATYMYHTGWHSHIDIISLILTVMLFWFWSGDIDVLMGAPSSHLMPMHSINNLYSLSFKPYRSFF